MHKISQKLEGVHLPPKLTTGLDRFGGTVKKAMMAFLGVIALITVIPAQIGGRIYKQLSGDSKLRRELKNGLAENRKEAILNVEQVSLKGLSPKLARAAGKIVANINKLPKCKGDLHDYIQKRIRTPLVNLINSKEYQKLREPDNDIMQLKQAIAHVHEAIIGQSELEKKPSLEMIKVLTGQMNQTKQETHQFVIFVENLAHALHSESKVGSAYKDLGDELTGGKLHDSYRAPNGMQVLYQKHAQATKNNPGFGDSRIARVFVSHLHPEKLWHSTKERYFDGKSYNPFNHGNANATEGDFLTYNGPFRFVHGPTPTGEIFGAGEGIIGEELRHLERRGEVFLYHSLQLPRNDGEKERTKMLKTLAKNHPNMYLLITPMDGPAIRMLELDFNTVDELHHSYLNYAKSGNPKQSEGALYRKLDSEHGFYCDPRLMSDKDFEKVFLDVKKSFGFLDTLLPHLSFEERSRLGSSYQAIVQAALSLKAMGNLKNKGTFVQSCSQGIDRGRVLNTITRILASDMKFANAADLKEIIGLTIGRAKLVIGREMLTPHAQMLNDALLLLLLQSMEETTERNWVDESTLIDTSSLEKLVKLTGIPLGLLQKMAESSTDLREALFGDQVVNFSS